MGEVSAALADYTILTDDDPRGEDPEGIIDQIAGRAAALDKRRAGISCEFGIGMRPWHGRWIWHLTEIPYS